MKTLTVFSDPIFQPLVSESTVSIFTKFSQLVDVWESLIKRSFFLPSFKGRCMATKWAEFADLTFIRRIGVPKLITELHFRFQKIKCQ